MSWNDAEEAGASAWKEGRSFPTGFSPQLLPHAKRGWERAREEENGPQLTPVVWQPVSSAPLNEWLHVKHEAETGENVCFVRQFPGEEREWIDCEGRTTVTHSTFLAPTHWRPIEKNAEGLCSLVGCGVTLACAERLCPGRASKRTNRPLESIAPKPAAADAQAPLSDRALRSGGIVLDKLTCSTYILVISPVWCRAETENRKMTLTQKCADWASSILTALGDEPALIKKGLRSIETAERFLWVSGAQAAAEHLCVMIGDAACEDTFCAAYINGLNAGLPITDFNEAADRLKGNARQQGVKFLRGFVAYAAEISA